MINESPVVINTLKKSIDTICGGESFISSKIIYYQRVKGNLVVELKIKYTYIAEYLSNHPAVSPLQIERVKDKSWKEV